MFEKLAGEYLGRTQAAIDSIDLGVIREIINVILRARDSGGIVYLAGNGGSASTASHYAVDLMKTSATDHKIPIRAISLTDNMAVVTALANDIGYSQIFSEQVNWLIRPEDVLVAISASGNSSNIIEAVSVANSLGATTIGISGFGGGHLAEIADICLKIDSAEYGPVEDAHLVIGHMLTFVLQRIPDRR